MAENQPTEEQWHARFLAESVNSTATRLNRCAADLNRLAATVQLVGKSDHSSYGQVAANAIRELTTLLANLPLDRMIREASDADVARVKGV